MKTTSWILAMATGLVIGATLVIACSDDSPGDADAAVCDCPAAEPPLTGRIMSIRSGPNSINAGGAGFQAANCPIGATLLGGACEVTNVDANVLVMESRIQRGSNFAAYTCSWSALNATVANTGVAEAICLIPAP